MRVKSGAFTDLGYISEIAWSNINKENFLKLMYDTDELANDVGSILIGEEAVKHGLIDEVGGLNKAMDKLYELISIAKEK